ncbi:pentatricopeptide repeat-containing protein [Tanacetum coccineum]
MVDGYGFGVVEFNDIWVCEDGIYKGALELFKEMKRDGFEPDEMTVVSVLGVCGDLGLGKVVEEYVVENEMEVNSYVGSALIGMYSKCGDLVSARRVFDKMVTKDLVMWNAMITGYWNCTLDKFVEASMIPRKKCPQACRTRDVALRKRNQQTIDIMLLGSEIRFFRMLQLIRIAIKASSDGFSFCSKGSSCSVSGNLSTSVRLITKLSSTYGLFAVSPP